MAVTPTDLFAFGPRSGPRPPRVGVDLFPDSNGMIGPVDPDAAVGASLFADPGQARLHGHYHRLPGGTVLPDGFEVVADGRDVNPRHHHRATHHTIYPSAQMHVDKFCESFANLPWLYAGRM